MDSFVSSNTIQQALCLRCKQLDIIPAFLAEDEAVPATGKSIISLCKRSERPSCEMCRFFLDLSPSYIRNHKQHVRLFDHIRHSSLSPKLSALIDLPRTRFLSVLRENSRLQYDYEIKDEIIQSGIIVYLPTDVSAISPSPVHLINAATVDFGLLNSLIKHCQSSHSLCTQVESRCSLPYIYLINCVEERVVREHPNQNYLALSYVWGEPNSQATSQFTIEEKSPEGPFSFSEAPLTVQDAIRVVRNLGRNYLWVDRYCINQTGGREKMIMLQNMDHIYENAEATIVAMYGENAEAGLPGVSRVSRKPQPLFRTTQGCLVSSCPPISTLIRTSKWATRGWTYQEARLSRRCLFFTEHQVYIVCRETTWSEAVPSDSRCWISTLLNSSRLDAGIFGLQDSIADGFCRDRLVFSQRTLTYESNILDAFRGILKRSSFVTFWGVPITPLRAAMNPHTGLALGLLWTRTPSWAIPKHLVSNKKRLRIRRVNFPTWSWTSATGEIFNEGYGSQSVFSAYLAADDRVSNQSDAYIQFWIYIGGKQIALDKAMQQQQQHSTILPEESHFLLVEGDLVRLTLTNGKQPYRVWGCAHLSLEFWATFDLDQDMAADSHQDGDQSSVEEALILVDWNDSQRKTKKRFVLMLLKWIGGNLAERRGLLSDYRKEYDAAELNKIPRIRKMFTLQ